MILDQLFKGYVLATVLQYQLSVVYGDDANKLYSHEVYLTEAAAEAWITAIGDAGRAATDVGVYVTALDGLTRMNRKTVQVRKAAIDDAFVFPSTPGNEVYGFDKATFSTQGGIRRYVTTIPGRDMSAIDTTNGTEIILADGDSVAAWVTAYQAIARSINDDALTVIGGYIAR